MWQVLCKTIWTSGYQLKTANYLSDLASALVKNVQDKNPPIGNLNEIDDMEELFITEHTIDTKTPMGDLSLVANTSIEQFSRYVILLSFKWFYAEFYKWYMEFVKLINWKYRMNGSTGKKMQMAFKALVPDSISSNSRNLVEYCCRMNGSILRGNRFYPVI